MRSFFQGSLGYFGFELLEPFVAYHTPYLPLDARTACLEQLGERFGDLGAVPAMTMPDLSLRSEEHTSELQSLMRISYAVFCLKKKNNQEHQQYTDLSSITIYSLQNNSLHTNQLITNI